MKSEIVAGLDLAAYINFGRGVLADQNDRETGGRYSF